MNNGNSKSDIEILDAMMGSGKTTKVIERIKDADPQERFIVITPFLNECHRYAGTSYSDTDAYKRPITVDSVDGTVLYDYQDDAPLKNKRFKHPYFSKHGGKAESLPLLIEHKENIVSTHALFLQLNSDILKQVQDYTLVIDEALSVYELYDNFSKKELDSLFKLKILSLEDDKITLKFNYDNFGNADDKDNVINTAYGELAKLADAKQLSYIDNKLIVWELGIDTIKAFKDIWICTYLFEDSIMSSYLKSHGLEYRINRFGDKPSDIKHLINIYSSSRKDSLNGIGNRTGSLSKSYYSNRRNKPNLLELSKSLESFFRGACKAKKGDRLWTTFKDYRSVIGGTRFNSEWIPLNTKATNEYGHITNVAYLINLYPNPMIVKATSQKGYTTSEERYALAEMLQFIWRTAIRNGKEINLFIPSNRMRTLLIKWLNDEYETD